MAEGHQQQLLLQAAEVAVAEHQAGRAAASVADILHLEKRWGKLPGSSTGTVSLEDAKGLLGQEVLAGEPLEYVVRQVFAAQPTLAVLNKRQFLALAHVAEAAQSKAFDLVTAEDSLRLQPPPASHKKRPPVSIRDTRIDTWQIAAAAPAAHDGGEHATDGNSGAGGAATFDEPGPLEAALPQGRLSRASSLQLPAAAGPLEQGVQALSRQNSADDLTVAAEAAAMQPGQRQYKSGGTSYQSALEQQEAEELRGLDTAEEEQHQEDEGGALPLDAEVDEFTTKLNGLMHKMSGDMARFHVDACPPTPEGLLPADDSAAAVTDRCDGAAAPPVKAASSEKARGSWESFSSTPKADSLLQQQSPALSGGAPSLAAIMAQQAVEGGGMANTPPQQQQHMNETLVAAAMAAGMTFMQHLHSAGGGHQASPFSDINPLRQASAAAAAAAAAATSPPMQPATAAGYAAAAAPPQAFSHVGAAGMPQQLIAEMMSRMNLGNASAEELQAAANSLHQQALSMQQQHQQAAGSRQGSAGSSMPSADRQQQQSSLRQSWHAFSEERHQQQEAASMQQPSRLARQESSAGTGPVTVGPPTSARSAHGLVGWTAMSKDDVRRCEEIFKKKGYPAVGGMERHSGMEYFAKLHMEPQLFHNAWSAADLGRDGRLDSREFCLFVQLLRGAQKGRALPGHLSAEEAAGLLGEGPIPAAPTGQEALHIDASRMRSALAGSSRQTSLSGQDDLLQDFDDGASSADSGIAESVVSMSVGSRKGPPGPAGNSHYSLGRSAQPSRTGLGSVLGGFGGGGGGGASAAGGYHPGAYAPQAGLVGYAGDGHMVAHSLLEVAVRSAEIKYNRALNMPIFSISVRDSLGRLVELPIDTHPGHYRKETNMIYSSAIIKLTTQLRNIPPGSVLYLEIKHWKSDKKRFSTLAWSFAPLDKLVDFGPVAARVGVHGAAAGTTTNVLPDASCLAGSIIVELLDKQVRSGPVDLPLYKKPMDPTLRRTKRLTSRAFDLHLTVRGLE